MVTNPLKWLARKILRAEIAKLEDELRFVENARAYAYKQYCDSQELREDLRGYCKWLLPHVHDVDPHSNLLFIRDMLDHGPQGPRACTHGVHPAARWNMTAYYDYKRGVRS